MRVSRKSKSRGKRKTRIASNFIFAEENIANIARVFSQWYFPSKISVHKVGQGSTNVSWCATM